MDFAGNIEQFLETDYPQAESSIFRDLSLNFRKLLTEGQLSETERALNLLAISTTLANASMAGLAAHALKELGLTAEQIREAAEVAGIMGMNNVYYKFRAYVSKDVLDQYSRAGLRMQSLMKPQNGKQIFEMMALSVSIINGCPSCVESHEKSLRDLGVSTEQIHDLVRLAAVAKGLDSLKTAREFVASFA